MITKDNSNSDIFIDFGFLVKEIKKHWYLFAIFLFLSIAGVVLFNKMATPRYTTSTSILIKNQTQNAGPDPNQLLSGFSLFNNIEDFENELQLMKSTQIIRKTIQKLNLSVSYYEKQQFVLTELYNNSPFIVIIDQDHVQPVDINLNIVFIDNSNFVIKAVGDNVALYKFREDRVYSWKKDFSIDIKGKVGTTIVTDNYSFTIVPNQAISLNNYANINFYFRFNNLFDQAITFQSNLSVEPAGLETSVAIVNLETENIAKGIDVLNGLIQEYLIKSLERKNTIAQNTIDYIDKQLYEIEDSLSLTENQLQNFRVSNQVMDITSKSGKVYDQLQELENQRYATQMKKGYYEYIIDQFGKNKDENDILLPSSMGVDDNLITQLLQQYTSLISEKIIMTNNNQQKSPRYVTVSNQLDNLKTTILDNLKSNLNAIDINLGLINQRVSKYQVEINKLPKTERELIGIQRKYKIKDAIYTFLLEKRAESQIAKASNIPNSEIIEPPKFINKSYPNPLINYAVALFAGLMLPLLILFIKNVLNDKILNRNEIEKLSDYPIIGELTHNYRKSETVFVDYPNSSISESLRTIRTNLDYFTKGTDKKVFLITSSIGGEGKSFISINLALCFSVFNKKTIVLEFDLRKPTLHLKLNYSNMIGISSYLINKANIDDIIVKTKYPNLDFIASGPIPPNPSELIAYEKTERLINLLKEKYDYIIIDTAPSGIVTDSFLLMKHSDIKIFIIRQNFTPKSEIKAVLHDFKSKNIENIAVAINDVNLNDSNKKSYGYYVNEPTGIKRFFKKTPKKTKEKSKK